MPLKKLTLRPGVNKENTRYTNENGWYDSDKIRFRQSTPEKIGGWQRISASTFVGICRSLWAWVTLGAANLLGVGTSLKFYIENGGAYYDITPIRALNVLTNPFTTTSGSTTVVVTDTIGGYINKDYVIFYPSYLFTVAITGTAGQFSCATTTLTVGQAIKISGTFGGTGSITGYTDPTTYYIIATNGTTTFTLSATSGGSAITTTAGTPTGLTYTQTVGGLSITGEYAISYVATNLSNVAITGTAGQFSCNSAALFVGQALTISGTYGGTGSITGYVNPTTYFIIATNGTTTFTLSATLGGSAIATTAGSPSGLTYSGVAAFTIQSATAATSTANGGGVVNAVYEINNGPDFAVTLNGWGAAAWGSGAWGIGGSSTDSLRLWSQTNFGEDLIFGPRGGPIYYWDASIGITGSTFTVTIASPGVLSTSLNLTNGTALTLTTTGALPTGLTVGTVYYVVGVSGTSFSLAATYGGSAINTTGVQSGVHSFSPRGIALTALGGGSSVPLIQNFILVSDTSRFVFAFGTNDYGTSTQNPMLVRWSDQESVVTWTPAATNQAGSLLFSHGSEIITAMQARQEILVWTDSSLYSLQYVGAPVVWGSQLVGDNTSIASENAVAYANGVAYWMGVDKFYKYDGRTQTLQCDLRQYVFENINKAQFQQVFAGTNEGFNEIWWFYCSGTSTVIDSYVVFNYAENQGQGCWYYGSLGRTAWLDSGLRDYPIAATYSYNIVNHEQGVDNNETGTTLPIEAFINSAEFDVDDGDKFGFVWRVLPDFKFDGSTAASPQVTLTLKPMQNSGSGYNDPTSLGGSDNASVTRTATVPIEKFTGQVYIRVRGRQMAMEYRSTALGVQWQAGSPRLDIRQDGRR